MSVTLAQATTQVRFLIDEPTAAYWSNTELHSYINEGCRDVARRAETKQSIHTVTVVVDTNRYTMPATVSRLHKVEYLPTGSTLNYTLEYRGLMEMDQIWGINRQWPNSYPLYYTIWKNPPTIQIIVYPVPQTAGVLRLYYYQQATTATTTTAAIDILPGYEDMIYDYAAYRALRKDGNPIWKTHQSIYEQKLKDLYDKSRTYQDQANYFSTGQQALPNWLVGTEGGY